MKNSDKLGIENSAEGNYRYPGSRPFDDTEVDRCLFFGRDSDTQLLLNKTLNWGLVVLYARSGVGKTSLINAGLCQEFRNKGYVPIVVRMNTPDKEPLETFYQGIKGFAAQKNLDYEHGEEDSLWQFFRTTYFWESVDTRLKPVLILDQFEEFFISYSREERKTFIQNLADLVNNTVPEQLLASIPPGQKLPYNLDEPGIKIIISIREDFLGQLEEMSRYIPSILSDRFRLMPLTREQANEAIKKPAQKLHKAIHAAPFMFTDEAVKMMLDFLCKQNMKYDFNKADEVEPFQLQILCRYIEDKVREKCNKLKGEDEIIIGKEDLGDEKGMQRILQQYYEEQLMKLSSFAKKQRARRLIERGLISIDDRRLSLEEGEIKRKYRVSENLLKELIQMRLLRSEPHVNSLYYELSHDSMLKPIRNSQRQRKSNVGWKNIGVWLFMIFIFISILLYWPTINKKIRNFRTKSIMKSAQKLIYNGKKMEALKQYYKILEINKTDVNVYLTLGKFFIDLKEYKKAIDIYKSALDNGVNDKLIYYQLGKAYIKNDQSEKAIINYKQSLELFPRSALLYGGLGEAYYNLGQFNEAIQNYKEALNNNKNAPQIYKKLILTYIINNDLEFALKKFEEDLSTNPEYVLFYEDITMELIERGRMDIIEKISDIVFNRNSKDVSVYLNLGRNYKTLKKYERSIESFKKAIIIDPANDYSYFNLGAVLTEIRKYTEAVEAFEKAIDLNPKNINTYNVMGYPLLKLKKYEKAIEAYENTLKISQGYIPAKMNLLEVYFVSERFDMAIYLANELLKEKNMPIENIIALKFIKIASLFFQQKEMEAINMLKEFIKYFKSIKEEYNKSWRYDIWRYDIIREFIEKNNKLLSRRALLLKLIDLIELPLDIKKIEDLMQEIFRLH